MRPKITEAAAGVFHIEGAHTNWQFIVSDGHVCLVDTGYPRDLPAISAALAEVGRSPGDIVAIILTHAHPDHVGTASQLHREHGISVMAHTDEVPHALGQRIEQVRTIDLLVRSWRPHTLVFALNAVWRGGLWVKRPSEIVAFEEGVPLDVPGRPVPVATPGHTSGHCSFHLPGAGVVIAGDALVTVDPLTGTSGPRLLPEIFDYDPVRSRSSLAQIAALDADVVLPGHGASYRGKPGDAVELALTSAPTS